MKLKNYRAGQNPGAVHGFLFYFQMTIDKCCSLLSSSTVASGKKNLGSDDASAQHRPENQIRKPPPPLSSPSPLPPSSLSLQQTRERTPILINPFSIKGSRSDPEQYSSLFTSGVKKPLSSAPITRISEQPNSVLDSFVDSLFGPPDEPALISKAQMKDHVSHSGVSQTDLISKKEPAEDVSGHKVNLVVLTSESESFPGERGNLRTKGEFIEENIVDVTKEKVMVTSDLYERMFGDEEDTAVAPLSNTEVITHQPPASNSSNTIILVPMSFQHKLNPAIKTVSLFAKAQKESTESALSEGSGEVTSASDRKQEKKPVLQPQQNYRVIVVNPFRDGFVPRVPIESVSQDHADKWSVAEATTEDYPEDWDDKYWNYEDREADHEDTGDETHQDYSSSAKDPSHTGTAHVEADSGPSETELEEAALGNFYGESDGETLSEHKPEEGAISAKEDGAQRILTETQKESREGSLPSEDLGASMVEREQEIPKKPDQDSYSEGQYHSTTSSDVKADPIAFRPANPSSKLQVSNGRDLYEKANRSLVERIRTAYKGQSVPIFLPMLENSMELSSSLTGKLCCLPFAGSLSKLVGTYILQMLIGEQHSGKLT